MSKKVRIPDARPDARDVLESKDPDELSDGEHIALALYALADAIEKMLEELFDDEEEDR